MKKATLIALATGALIGSASVASTPALADDWRHHGRHGHDYYRHGDNGWRHRGYDYRGYDYRGYGYRSRTMTRCAWNGCAVFRCDDGGGRCVRVGPWYPRWD